MQMLPASVWVGYSPCREDFRYQRYESIVALFPASAPLPFLSLLVPSVP